ncbi:MAG: hypothetical protein SPLM_09810 [Spiroplasma phoeniceum]|uniref:hypothetical protein n=1 Tax=Spiroplasma phoeniceum TaxID=47835 RepID=UPI003133F7DD
MKKLLSLLSVLTISGSAVPTTIAASPYQKEKNNKINLSHKNKNTLWKTAFIFGKTIAKTTDDIKDNLFKIKSNNNLIKDSDSIKENILNSKKTFNIKNSGDEVDIYFDISHREMTFPMVFKYNHWNASYHMIDINIEKINPKDYKYIQFLPRHNNDSIHTYVIWGKDRPYRGKTINEALNKEHYELKYFIKNTKVENNNDSIKKNLNINLQHNSYQDGLAWIDVDQSMGLTSYYDTDDQAFHLQILSGQYVGPKWSFSGGRSSIGIGAYIVLSK